jgi:mRNA interferase RelE/StbE
MHKYIIVLSKKAQKILGDLSDYTAEPIHNAIMALEKNPRPIGCKKLKDRNAYRIRTGNYRVIYDIIDNKLIINVITVGHRKDVYKN